MRFQRRRHSFRPPGKSVGQERAARSFRPEIWRPSTDGMKLAPFGRSDSHSVRALRAAKSCSCGPGSIPMGGELHPRFPVSCIFSNAHPLCFPFLSGGAGQGKGLCALWTGRAEIEKLCIKCMERGEFSADGGEKAAHIFPPICYNQGILNEEAVCSPPERQAL